MIFPNRLLFGLAVFLFSHVALHADIEIAKLQWENRNEGVQTDLDFRPATVGVDADGNIFVAASSSSPSSDSNFYVAKHAAGDGQLLWEKRYAGRGYDDGAPTAIVVDTEGNVIVAGEIEAETYPGSNLCLVKFSGSDGTLLWEQRQSRGNSSTAKAITLDAEGNVLVTGEVKDNQGLPNVITLKCSGTTGQVLWESRYTGDRNWRKGGTAIAADGTGNAIISGYLGNYENNVLRYDFYTAKYSGANGALMWEKTIEEGYAQAVGLDSAGNAVVAGHQAGGAYTIKLAVEDGATLWERRYSGIRGVASIQALSINSNGDVFVAGRSAVYIDPNPNLGGTFVLYTAKYDGTDGHVVWKTDFGTPSDPASSAYALSLDSAENPVIVGTYSNNGGNILVAKYNATNGAQLWRALYRDPSTEVDFINYPGPLALALDDSIAIGGLSYKDGNRNFVVLKYDVSTIPSPIGGTVTEITANGASITGTAVSAGLAPQTVWFKAVNEIDSVSTNQVTFGGAAGTETPISAQLTDLLPHTTYKLRIFVNIAGHILEGKEVSFTTLNTNPSPGSDAFVLPEIWGSTTLNVLPNDSDVDGDTLTLTSVSDPEHGRAKISNQRIVYTPVIGYEGSDEFTYTVVDEFGGSATATVRISRPRTIAESGRGENVAEVFIPDSNKAFPVSRIGVPSIDGALSERFLVYLRGPRAGTAIVDKRFRALLSSGGTVPGVPNARFLSFRDPLLNENGKMVLLARIEDGRRQRSGIFTDSFSTEAGAPVSPIALTGEQAPGTPANARWSSFVSVALLDSGAVPFVAKLASGPGNVTAQNDFGLWISTAEGTALLLREGQKLEFEGTERKVRSFSAFSTVAASPGHGRLSANAIPVRVQFTDGTSGLFTASSSGLVLRTLTGEIAEGTDGARFVGFGLPALNEAGGMAFSATLNSEAARISGIFTDTETEGLRPIVLQGATAPGVEGATFTSFLDPVYNAGERVAFIASARGSVTRSSATGIWWNRTGELSLVARTGAAAPGIINGKFTSFTSLALPDGELAGPVFVAEFQIAVATPRSGSKPRPENGTGLWAIDSTGTLRLIVREGEIVDGKKIVRLTALGAVSASPAQSRSYNDMGQIVYSVYYDDGSTSIVRFTVP